MGISFKNNLPFSNWIILVNNFFLRNCSLWTRRNIAMIFLIITCCPQIWYSTWYFLIVDIGGFLSSYDNSWCCEKIGRILKTWRWLIIQEYIVGLPVDASNWSHLLKFTSSKLHLISISLKLFGVSNTFRSFLESEMKQFMVKRRCLLTIFF